MVFFIYCCSVNIVNFLTRFVCKDFRIWLHVIVHKWSPASKRLYNTWVYLFFLYLVACDCSQVITSFKKAIQHMGVLILFVFGCMWLFTNDRQIQKGYTTHGCPYSFCIWLHVIVHKWSPASKRLYNTWVYLLFLYLVACDCSQVIASFKKAMQHMGVLILFLNALIMNIS